MAFFEMAQRYRFDPLAAELEGMTLKEEANAEKAVEESEF
jgi:hypothetical protein